MQGHHQLRFYSDCKMPYQIRKHARGVINSLPMTMDLPFWCFLYRDGMTVVLQTINPLPPRDARSACRHSAVTARSALGTSPELSPKWTGKTCTCTSTGTTREGLGASCTRPKRSCWGKFTELVIMMLCCTSRKINWREGTEANLVGPENEIRQKHLNFLASPYPLPSVPAPVTTNTLFFYGKLQTSGCFKRDPAASGKRELVHGKKT